MFLFFIFILGVGVVKCSYNIQNITSHPNWPTEENSICGKPSAFRIIGGKNAALGEYPYIARLGYIDLDFIVLNENELDVSFQCAGSLFTKWHVITAGHCLDIPSNTKLSIVRLGENYAKSPMDCENGVCADLVQDIKVESSQKHEAYDKMNLIENDIGIIKLQNPAEYTTWVQPICLPHGKYFKNFQSFINRKVEIAGWGLVNVKNRELANVLQKVKVSIVSSELCQMHQLFETQFCAGHKTKDSCNGDSGGPVVMAGLSDSGPRYYLVGLVSYGDENCGSGNMAVYTKIQAFLEWILDHME